jgi:predicted HD phosphohydrolase
MTAVQEIGELFAGPGARDYLGEPVTIGVHMRQAGALAEAAGADRPLVAAALLHDIGHLRLESVQRHSDQPHSDQRHSDQPHSDQRHSDQRHSDQRHSDQRHSDQRHSDQRHSDQRHGEAGARWLSRWFGEAVTEPVRLHVAAKRYLCAVEPGYFGLLSGESVRTLARQGGAMTPEEVAAFEALPHARDAVAVRRWDDQAKDPAITPPAFAHFAPLLQALVLL